MGPCHSSSGPAFGRSVREVREAAITGIQRVVVLDDPATVEMLVARSSHGDWPVRCAAIRALSGVVKHNAAPLREVAEQLKSSEYTPAKVLSARILQDRDEEEGSLDDFSADLASAEAARYESAVCDEGSVRATWHCDDDDDSLTPCFSYSMSQEGVMDLEKQTWADLVD